MSFERKFLETITTDEWEIETDSGWVDIKAIGKTIPYEQWVIETKNRSYLICADTHIVFDKNYNEVFVKDLKIGDKIITKSGIDEIILVSKINNDLINMFDVELEDNSDHRYWTGNILSHNSMWVHNLAVNAVNIGKNVLIITLEMSTPKVVKRLGSMRLKIPVNDYDEASKDTAYIKRMIANAKGMNNGSTLFNDGNPGKIFIKKYNTGDCTVTNVDDLIKSVEERKKIKLNMVIVDYINLMSIEKHVKDIKNNLYQKGKYLAEGLRGVAGKHTLVFLTPTQVDKSAWGASIVRLDQVPESKAVVETCDTCYAIIRTPDMKRFNQYILQVLKFRDNDHNNDKTLFDFDKTYLRINNDRISEH
jgi:hypothetical protein